MTIKSKNNKPGEEPCVPFRLTKTDISRHKEISSVLNGLPKTGRGLPRGSVPLGSVVGTFLQQLSPLLPTAKKAVWIRATHPGAPHWVFFIPADDFLQGVRAELVANEPVSAKNSERGEKLNKCTSISLTHGQNRCLRELAKRIGLPPGTLITLAIRRFGNGFPQYLEEQRQLLSFLEGLPEWFDKQRRQDPQPPHA